ncbi:hypothetical protein EWP21_11935, partial [Neisseria meningitidis]|nr:hypothetical protein [Neisseria meningitidis]
NLPNIEQKVGKIRKVLHFENEIEHKILVTYVIAKVSGCYIRIVVQTKGSNQITTAYPQK